MNIIEKEVKFRLGDLFDMKIDMNPTLVFCKRNKHNYVENNIYREYPHINSECHGGYWRERKNLKNKSGGKTCNHHTRGFLAEDLNYIASSFDKEFEIPIGYGDRDESESGYVFSYARASEDMRVGLLNDHWFHCNISHNRYLLTHLYQTPKQIIKHVTGERVLPKKQRDENIKWLKKNQVNTSKLELDNMTIQDLENSIVSTVKFRDKAPVLYWTGSRTKGFNSFQRNLKYQAKAVERWKIVEYFEDNPCEYINITFTNKPPKKYLKNTGRLSTNAATVQQVLNYANVGHKYLIELQGNDYASNAYWIYNKDCIVFRPDFLKSNSVWDCHLEPWIHYVPFSHADYGDLVDKIKWCENNTKKCEKIIRNANNLNTLIHDADHRFKVYSLMLEKIKQNLKN